MLSRRSAVSAGPLLGLVGLCCLFAALLAARGELGNFASASNLRVLVHKASVPGVVALGALLVIVSGGIDLSAGSVLALAAVSAMQTYRLVHDGPDGVLRDTDALAWLRERGLAWSPTRSAALATAACLAAGLATGALCGLANGLAVARLRLPAFVATLGMTSVARGLAIWLARRERVTFGQNSRPAWVEAVSRADHPALFFDPGVWLLALLAALVALTMRRTVFGRHVFAIGSNEPTARLCGVPVARDKTWVYVLAGLLAALGGVLTLAHTNGGGPDTGQMLELEVIAGVVIGGASLRGGEGGVGGTLLGVLILGVLENGLGLLDVPVETKHVLIGVIIVAALSLWQRQRD